MFIVHIYAYSSEFAKFLKLNFRKSRSSSGSSSGSSGSSASASPPPSKRMKRRGSSEMDRHAEPSKKAVSIFLNNSFLKLACVIYLNIYILLCYYI